MINTIWQHYRVDSFYRGFTGAPSTIFTATHDCWVQWQRGPAHSNTQTPATGTWSFFVAGQSYVYTPSGFISGNTAPIDYIIHVHELE